MNYKIGDKVICSVENKKDGSKRLVIGASQKDSKITKKEFIIVAFDEPTQNYKLIVDDDMVGWTISKWHIKYQDVPEKYLGKQFYDVPEFAFEGKKK